MTAILVKPPLFIQYPGRYPFQHYWTYVLMLTYIDIIDLYWHYWPVLTLLTYIEIIDLYWHYWPILTLLTYIDIIDIYLRCSEQWRTWLGWLQPWFKYDQKLSYSFLYVLSPEQMITLLNSDDTDVYSLPLNAVIAKVKLCSSKVSVVCTSGSCWVFSGIYE